MIKDHFQKDTCHSNFITIRFGRDGFGSGFKLFFLFRSTSFPRVQYWKCTWTCIHSPVQIYFPHSWDFSPVTRIVQGTQKKCFQEHAGCAAFELVMVSLMEIALWICQLLTRLLPLKRKKEFMPFSKYWDGSVLTVLHQTETQHSFSLPHLPPQQVKKKNPNPNISIPINKWKSPAIMTQQRHSLSPFKIQQVFVPIFCH